MLKETFADTFEKQKRHKLEAKNTSAAYRLKKLTAFKRLMLAKKAEIALALKADFRKPQVETDLTEIMPVVSMINLLEKNLESWMKEKKVKTPLLFQGTKSWIRKEGKGNCLIISPWNYPFQLTVYPVLTAFAAGNTSLVKPSEFTPNVNAVIGQLFQEVFEQEEVAMFEGGAELSTNLLKLPFDHIFFTGSTEVGKIVMEAAAKNLASVSLELGGKSPCVMDRGAELEKACKKLAWGKLVNAGQTCVAPDYLLVYEEDLERVVASLIQNVKSFFPEENFVHSPDYNQIISARHGERLDSLIKDAVEKGARAAYGGVYHSKQRVLEPTILTNVSNEMKIMNEEIFGPVLPIVAFKTKSEMLDFINGKDNALAFYIFSDSERFCQEFMNLTNNGGVTINDTLISVGHPLLPFGGAGKSGIGKYHGEFGFDEFSNMRAVVKRNMDLGVSYFYPPYSNKKVQVVDSLLKKLSKVF